MKGNERGFGASKGTGYLISSSRTSCCRRCRWRSLGFGLPSLKAFVAGKVRVFWYNNDCTLVYSHDISSESVCPPGDSVPEVPLLPLVVTWDKGSERERRCASWLGKLLLAAGITRCDHEDAFRDGALFVPSLLQLCSPSAPCPASERWLVQVLRCQPIDQGARPYRRL